MIQDFGSSNGYRFIWYKLNTEGIRILPIRVQQMLKEIDSKIGLSKVDLSKVDLSKSDYEWHLHGYDKLKTFDFAILAKLMKSSDKFCSSKR